MLCVDFRFRFELLFKITRNQCEPQHRQVISSGKFMGRAVFSQSNVKGEIEISATNHYTGALSGTVTLLFDANPGVHTSNEEGTVLRFEDLPGGGQVTGRVQFSWNAVPRLFNVDAVAFQTWVSLDDGRRQMLAVPDPPTVAIPKVPYLNTVLGWLRGTVIVAGLGGLLWEQVKKRLFPSD